MGALFILEKANKFSLKPASPHEALQYFWGEYAPYRCALTTRLRKKAFDLIYGASRAAPVYRIKLPKGGMDWDAVKRAMHP